MDKIRSLKWIRACLKIEEMTDFLPKTVSFKEKTQSNRRSTRLFDAEDDRYGRKDGVFDFSNKSCYKTARKKL
jgi:hypothetical protein